MSTVYIVDDDASVLDSLALLLRLHGWEVRTFRSGETFLADVKAENEGCLVIDFNLGNMTAAEVLRRGRTAGVNLPAIVISSERPQTLRTLLADFPSVQILEKPLKEGELQAAIRQAQSREGA